MAFCINCGQELAEGAKFCANCGTSIGKSGRTQRETVYEGNLHKCPNCGELINAFVLNCPTCGHEIRDAENSSSVKELTSKLENVEEKRENEKIKSSYMSLMMGDAWKVQKTDEQKINLIRSFPIPNTKEDLLEFMILASSNIDMQVYGTDSNNINTFQPARRQISDAWLAKFEQAFNKAQIMFGTSQEFALLKQVHDNKMAEIKKTKRRLLLMMAGLFGGLILMLLLCFILIFFLS